MTRNYSEECKILSMIHSPKENSISIKYKIGTETKRTMIKNVSNAQHAVEKFRQIFAKEVELYVKQQMGSNEANTGQE